MSKYRKVPIEIAEGLEGIENKLLETGRLTSLVKDNNANCKINFKEIDDELYVSIEIFADVQQELDDDECEEVCDYVRSKIYDILEGRNDNVSKEFLDCDGEIIYLNEVRKF